MLKGREIARRFLLILAAVFLAVCFLPMPAAHAAEGSSRVKVTMGTLRAGSSADLKIEVTDSNSVIAGINDGSGYESLSPAKTVYEGSIYDLPPGKRVLKIYVKDQRNGSEETVEYPFEVLPKTPEFTANRLDVGYNSAKVRAGWDYNCGDTIYICNKKADGSLEKMEKISSSSTQDWVTVKNLKPSTVYHLCVVGSKNGVDGTPSKTVRVRTGAASKPKISSLKVSDVKVSKSTRRWVSGYWNGFHWITGHWTGGGYTTTYTLTVKLKAKHPGQKGLMIGGTRVSGSGRTFRKTFTEHGQLKYTYLSIASYQNSSWEGTSKKANRKIRLR